MKFVFMVLLLLVCSGISAALFTKYFDNVAIDHLLEIVLFNRSLCLWNSKSLSISNVSKARNFKNHERIASLSYGSIIIESMKSFDPFDSSHIERFYQNFPEPSISDYKVFLVKSRAKIDREYIRLTQKFYTLFYIVTNTPPQAKKT